MVIGGLGAAASWQVESGQRVGAFVLGMGVNEALAIVQGMGCLEKGAMLLFDERRLFDVDLSLCLPSLGLQLCFDGFRQDLRVISVNLSMSMSCGALEREVSDSLPSTILPLTYGGRPFAGTQHPALSIREIYNMIGPTYMGDFVSDGDQAFYFLRYPGLTFQFPLPLEIFEELKERNQQPMELPARPPPIANHMWVYAKSSPSFHFPASAWLEEPRTVIVIIGIGLELHGKLLRFGAMPQDVFSDFGPPDKVCVKTVDAVRIFHSSDPCVPGSDYFYNYFQLGVDVLFDGQTHFAKKIVLHTNPPTHESFSRYSRCFFQIPIEQFRATMDCGAELQTGSGNEQDWQMPEFTLEDACDPGSPFCQTDTEANPPAAPVFQHEASHGMEPPHEHCFSKFTLPFSDDWRTRLESELVDRGITSQEARLRVQIRDCDGELLEALCNELVAMSENRFPLTIAFASPHSSDLTREADGEGVAEDADDARTGGRRISKRERKAARKKRASVARAPLGSPLLQGDTSPDLSSATPSPSPHTIMRDPTAGSEDAITDLDTLDILPPPAVPVEEADEITSAKNDDGLLCQGGDEGLFEGSGVAISDANRQTLEHLSDTLPTRSQGGASSDIHIQTSEHSPDTLPTQTQGSTSAPNLLPDARGGPESSVAASETGLTAAAGSSADLGGRGRSGANRSASNTRTSEHQSDTLPAQTHGSNSAVLTSDASEPPKSSASTSARTLEALANGGFIDGQWSWSEIEDLLTRLRISCGKPLVVDKGGHSPFGSTHFYAMPGLAFEVMHNGFVASLTLFGVSQNEYHRR